MEKEVPRWDFSGQQTTTSEYSLHFSIYRFAYGQLSDPGGKREERSWSNSIEVNALRWWRFRTRLRTGDFSHDGESLENGFPFPEIRIGGIPYRANPAFSLGARKIRSRDNGIRDDQTSYFFSVSL